MSWVGISFPASNISPSTFHSEASRLGDVILEDVSKMTVCAERRRDKFLDHLSHRM